MVETGSVGVGTDQHAMTFGAFWRWITVLVPAMLAVSWYLSQFANDYAMLQITNTEQRCDRQDARARMRDLRILVLEAGNEPADQTTVEAIRQSIQELSDAE